MSDREVRVPSKCINYRGVHSSTDRRPDSGALGGGTKGMCGDTCAGGAVRKIHAG